MNSIENYDYDLPDGLIAQEPAGQRDCSNLLLLNRKTGDTNHHRFNQIVDLLLPSDILVVNNTRVIPGRLYGAKDTGGKVELLILDYSTPTSRDKTDPTYTCLVKSSKRSKPGATLYFKKGVTGKIISCNKELYRVKFSSPKNFETILYQIGETALPPYVKREGKNSVTNDRESYQTVYASSHGAIAAPTAGLHFTDSLLDRIKIKGIQIVEITLHVGYGTFIPVRVSDIREHKMHSERYQVSDFAAETINAAKTKGNRVITVGTTSVRTLEYLSKDNPSIPPGKGTNDLFIYPGYKFKIVDGIITNFHLPKSTLLMLVSAFAGRKNILQAYETAIKHRYRFYSYGDAMFIV